MATSQSLDTTQPWPTMSLAKNLQRPTYCSRTWPCQMPSHSFLPTVPAAAFSPQTSPWRFNALALTISAVQAAVAMTPMLLIIRYDKAQYCRQYQLKRSCHAMHHQLLPEHKHNVACSLKVIWCTSHSISTPQTTSTLGSRHCMHKAYSQHMTAISTVLSTYAIITFTVEQWLFAVLVSFLFCLFR